MLCDICHSREAVICYTEIINGVKKEQHMCKQCAAKYTDHAHQHLGLGSSGFLASLLAGVLGATDEAKDNEDMKKTNFVCPTCQMTYNEFLKYGKFGCIDCYKTFGLVLDPYLKKIQGNIHHVGKWPKTQDVFVNIPDFTNGDKTLTQPKVTPVDKPVTKEAISPVEQLKLQLKQAVEKEEYEQAAHIRDAIKAIELEQSSKPEDKAVAHD